MNLPFLLLSLVPLDGIPDGPPGPFSFPMFFPPCQEYLSNRRFLFRDSLCAIFLVGGYLSASLFSFPLVLFFRAAPKPSGFSRSLRTIAVFLAPVPYFFFRLFAPSPITCAAFTSFHSPVFIVGRECVRPCFIPPNPNPVSPKSLLVLCTLFFLLVPVVRLLAPSLI